MKYPHDIGKEPSLQKIVIISAILHLLFITIAVIPIKPRERVFRSYQVKLVGSLRTHAPGTGRGAGTVTSKKKRTLPPKKVRKKVPKKKVTRVAPKADVSLERAEKVSREIKKLRAISTLSKRKKERTREDEIAEEEMYGEVAGGIGIMGEGIQTDSDSYYALITEKIWNQWVYPDFDSKELEIIISIKIDKKGKIVSQEIERSSGNRLFDRSAAKALSKASPLPPPPVEMEIGVRFYL
ncbi:TonB C-terminal domain-containing protein [bacterium]|nr:MAG: TonB C-terminal domain-containing protein [bacterium]